MKLKDVCQQTGLTQKTVRFYEEQQLISPTSTIKNGRSYREYSEADVQALQEIAILRKALFSIEEIYLMQQEPDEIESVLRDYTIRIHELYDHLKYLNHTLEELQPEQIRDIPQLTQKLSGAANQLPLPAYDCNPKFRYLDAVEDSPRHVTPQTNLDDMVPSSQVFNQMVAGRLKGGFLLISANQITATRKSREKEWTPKWETIPEDPPRLHLIKKILSAIILLLILYFIWNWLAPYDIYEGDFSHLRLPCLIFLLITIARLTIAVIQYRKRQNHWLEKHRNH